LGSYSSRVTIMAGNAALQAATRAKSLIAEAVAIKFEISVDQIRFADHQVFDKNSPGRGVSFQDAIILAETKFGTLGTVGSYTPPKSPALYKGGGVGPSPTYSYSAAVIEVEVNPATGWLTVPKVWIAHDIGRALNPTLVRGQIEGSVYMGLGEALMEEQEFRRLPKKYSHALVHKFPSILEYKSPTSLDMPDVVTDLVEEPDPQGPYGAKEVGQGPLLPVIPAVANAVYDAVGVRVDESPITPEKIMKALAEKNAGRNPRYGPSSEFPKVAWGESLLVPPPWEGGDGYAINEKSRRARERQEKEKANRP
jgi:4-hydroxybenzoyl-CoA reductase subunit alpha